MVQTTPSSSVEKYLTLALMKLSSQIAVESGGTYFALEFRTMVEQQGGLATAKHFINTPPSEGLIYLGNIGRTDLTVEAIVCLNPVYQALFTESELRICEARTGNGKPARQ